MPSDISFGCPTCGASYRVPGEHVGRIAKCKKCNTRIRIPPAADRSAPSAGSDPPSPVPPPPPSLQVAPPTGSGLPVPQQAAGRQKPDPPQVGKAFPTPTQRTPSILNHGVPPETRPTPSPPAWISAQRPREESPAESAESTGKHWWKRSEVVWPLLGVAIGIGYIVTSIQAGSFVEPLKRWAIWIIVYVAIGVVRLCVGSLDKRFIEPLDKRIPWLKKILLIMLLVFLASVVGVAVWAVCFLD